MADDRIRMECHVCGYKSTPQWLNDSAHCLKCNAVLKRRQSCQEEAGGAAQGAAPTTRRSAGEVSTYKATPGSAMESESGHCDQSPTGVHHWKYGKCNYCQQAEGHLVKKAGAFQSPGGWGECESGGKCIFKFAKCTKCGRGEGGIAGGGGTARPASRQRPGSRSASPRPVETGSRSGGRGSVDASSSRAAGGGDKIKKAFEQFDADGNGVISLAELKAVLQSLPVPPGQEGFSDEDFDRFLNMMDTNHDGVIDYHEFTDWISHDGDNASVILDRMKTPKAGAGRGREPRGPERFFYDKSTYTGAHSQGGPSTTDTDKVNDLSEMTRPELRGPAQVVHSSGPLGSGCEQGGKCTFKFARCTKCGRSESSLGGPPVRPSSRVTATLPAADEGTAAVRVSRSPITDNRAPTGPERFFYDKSSYTGTHTRGGPESVATGQGTSYDQTWKRPG